MTNADRIRQMTDEELVEMVSMKVCRIVKPDGKDCPKGFYFGKCDKCVMKWLKKDVIGEPERSGRECFIPCSKCSSKYCYYRREETEADYVPGLIEEGL